MTERLPSNLEHTFLKEKQRRVRDDIPLGLTLRVHRALSWLERSEQEAHDKDAKFIFQWIAFNAAYAQDPAARQDPEACKGERSVFQNYFDTMVSLDDEKRIYNALWWKFTGPIRVILDNKFVFEPFWKFQNGAPEFDDWEDRFARNSANVGTALKTENTKAILGVLFDRLYVLRNQLIHGGATWNSKVNRDQVGDGSRILEFLVPIFVDIMMDNPNEEWGEVHYPVVDD